MATDRRGRRHRSGKPSRRRDLRGFWRTILALIAPLPGLLMAAKIMISPFGMREDFAAVLAGVSGDPAREQLALWLGLAFSLTVLPAVLAVAWASRRRSPWFALAGGVLSVIGFSVGFAIPDSSAAALVAVQQDLDATKVAVINEVVSATSVVSRSLDDLPGRQLGRPDTARCRAVAGQDRTSLACGSARPVRSGAPPSRRNRSGGRSLACHWDRQHRRVHRSPSVGER